MSFRGPKGARRFYTSDVARGDTLRYSPSRFPKAKLWELDQIARAEEELEPLRRRSRLLGQVAQITRSARAGEIREDVLPKESAVPSKTGPFGRSADAAKRERLVSDEPILMNNWVPDDDDEDDES